MKNKIHDFFYGIWSKFLVMFGELKIVKWFPWIQYDPVDWKITGDEYDELLKTLRPGDILLRSFDGYLENMFISGDWSHGAIYEGDGRIIHAVCPNVGRMHLFDFCKCDHIIALRPRCGQENALESARAFIGTPYDFGYETDDERLYCFELCAKCYLDLDVKKFELKWLFGLLSRNAVYYGKSFTESDDFEIIWQSN